MVYTNAEKWLSIDPGGTTGYCIYRPGQDLGDEGDSFVPMPMRNSVWHSAEIGPSTHHRDFWKLLTDEQPDTVVCENFWFQHRDKVELVSVEYIGIVKLWCELTQTRIVLQNPNQAKELWKDERLKRLGLHTPARPHANDAVRHMLYYITITKRIAKYIKLLRIDANTASTSDDHQYTYSVLAPDVVDLVGEQNTNVGTRSNLDED